MLAAIPPPTSPTLPIVVSSNLSGMGTSGNWGSANPSLAPSAILWPKVLSSVTEGVSIAANLAPSTAPLGLSRGARNSPSFDPTILAPCIAGLVTLPKAPT